MKKPRVIYNKKLEKKLEVFIGSPCDYMEIGDLIIITKKEKDKYAPGYSMTAPKRLIEQGWVFSNVIQPNGDIHFIRRS